MFTFIDNQTTWYNTKEKELKKVSVKMQMEYPQGRAAQFRKKLKAIEIAKAVAIGVCNIAEALNGRPSVEKFLIIQQFNATEQLLRQYYNIPFGDGYESAAVPISKQSNPYHCMHKNKFHEHLLNQQKYE